MNRLRFALVCALVLAAGCAGSGNEPLRRETTSVSTIRLRVAAIDKATRQVTFDNDAGEQATFYADPAVRNFDQVKVGDYLVGKISESLVVELREPTPAERSAGVSILDVVATAEPGQRPAGEFVRQIRAVLTVEAIDKAAQTVTLRGPAGNSKTVRVADPKDLDRARAGDSVVVTYTEALLLEVQAPAKP